MNPTELQHFAARVPPPRRTRFRRMPHPRPDPPALDPAQRPDADLEGPDPPGVLAGAHPRRRRHPHPGRAGQLPGDRHRGGRRRHRGRLQGYDNAAAPGLRCRWPSASPASRTSPTSWSPGAPRSSTHHVGDRQEPGRLAEGVRPHHRLHQATVAELKQLDNSNSRFQIVDGTIAQIRRSPLGIVLCLGPLQLPRMNETFCTLIPALIMVTRCSSSRHVSACCSTNPMLEAFRSAQLPAGAINIVYGQGSVVVPHIMASGKVKRAGADRHQQGRRRAPRRPTQDQPAARGAGPGSQERGDHPARRRHRADGQECLAGSLSFQRPALHRAQDDPGAPVDRRAVPAPLQRRARQAQDGHALGEGRDDHAAARDGQGRLHERVHRGRHG